MGILRNYLEPKRNGWPVEDAIAGGFCFYFPWSRKVLSITCRVSAEHVLLCIISFNS